MTESEPRLYLQLAIAPEEAAKFEEALRLGGEAAGCEMATGLAAVIKQGLDKIQEVEIEQALQGFADGSITIN